MSSEIAIQLRGISKVYRIYSRPADRLKQMLAAHRRQFYQEFWAVKSLDLEIRRGETIGIVGRNGAGKSTLLQMICGTLQPTTGTMRVNGRIAALLELGSGFNPEFTGRENVFMNAAILGLSQAEIERRLDSILQFADIGNFVDQPVKLYSSGMFARLAFAVAINVDPDIMVVDEALSVGDEAFQRKCFARLEAIRKSGATILFVSHSADRVVELCSRAILMEKGEKLLEADAKTTVAYYQKLAYAPQDKVADLKQKIRDLQTNPHLPQASTGGDGSPVPHKAQRLSAAKGDQPSAVPPAKKTVEQKPCLLKERVFDPHLKPKSTLEYESNGALIKNVRILDGSGNQVNILKVDTKYRYAYEIHFSKTVFNVRFGMMVKTITGLELGGLVSHAKGESLAWVEAGTVLKAEFQFTPRLLPGTYFTNTGVVGCLEGREVYLHRIIDILAFRVAPMKHRKITGMVDFSVSGPEAQQVTYHLTQKTSVKI